MCNLVLEGQAFPAALEGREAGWRRGALCWGIGRVPWGGQLQEQPPLAILLLSKWVSNALPTSVLACSCEKTRCIFFFSLLT